MAAEKTDAIVLRVVEFSETSCIVTLMTRDFGKITALAKGARRRKSPFEAALDVLAVCRIVFLKKPHGNMELLTEAKLEKRFRNTSQRLESLYAAYYVVELLRLLTDEGDSHPGAFQLAVDTLAKLDAGERVSKVLIQFELHLLRLLGHQPIFSTCAGCGRERTAEGRVSFGLDSGGVLCGNCKVGKRHIVSLSPAAWRFLAHLTDAIAEGTPEKFNDWPQGEVRKLLSSYISHLLGFQPRLHRFIETRPNEKSEITNAQRQGSRICDGHSSLS